MTFPPVVSANDINSDWIQSVLAHNGMDVQVTSLSAEPIGTGQMAHNLRLHLEASGTASEVPQTLVAKVASPDPTSRKSGGGVAGFYAREVNFYKHLASTANVTIPRCFYSEMDGSDFVIVLEDLAPAKPGDQIAGVSLEQARLVVMEAAKLHASHWGDTALDDVPWIVGSNTEAGRASASFPFARFWSLFCERYSDRLTEGAREVGDRYARADVAYQAGRGGTRCLVHNDFRPDNMMFATPEGGYPVSIVDWQTLGLGHGTADLSYFLGGALPPDDRKAQEESLLRGYYEAIVSMGVDDLSFDQLFEDYRFYSFQLFRSAVAGAMLTVQTARGDDMFFVMLEGATSQILDLEALHLLGASA